MTIEQLNTELKAKVAAAGYEGYVGDLIVNAIMNKNVVSLLTDNAFICRINQWYWAQAQTASASVPTSVEMWVQTLTHWAGEIKRAHPALTQIATVEMVALVFGLKAVEGTDYIYRLPHTGHVVGSPEGEPFRAWPK